MRNIIFIGQAGCKACERMYETVIAPLTERYPDNVSTHYKWDGAIERVNRRKTITRVPLIVVENGEREDFRFSGSLSIEQLEAVIECEGETLTLDDVLGGGLR